MKRLFSISLALVLLLSLAPPLAPAAAAADDGRPAAPALYIERNCLKLDGNVLTLAEAIKYEYVFISRLDTANFNPEEADVADLDELWKVPYIKGLANPTNIKTGCMETGTGMTLTLNAGDYVMIRRKESGTTAAGHWTIIKLADSMFAFSTTESPADLPGLAVTATGLTVTPKNIYTPYEYAIIPENPPEGWTLQWTYIGAATASADGKTISASFRARSSAYTVRVRVEGDDKAGYLYSSAKGVSVASPVLSLAGEYIGPLGGMKNGAVWYLSTDGKKWTTIAVPPGEDAYFELGKIFGKKEVTIQVRGAEVPYGEDAPPAEDAKAVLRETVNPRPSFPKDAKASGFAGAASPSNWTVTGSVPKQLEYLSADGSAWLPFSTETGLPLLTAAEQSSGLKPAKVQVRLPANEATRTPASAAKKLTQQKQVKAPALKPDYKGETIKTKGGIYYYCGPVIPVETAKFKAAGDYIDIAEALDKGWIVYAYTAESGAKSRSAVQTITLAKRGEAPDYGEGIIIEKDKFKLEKGFEYYGSKAKWGSLSKGDAKGYVRRKATAKYNAKTGVNTGEAASKKVPVGFVYSEDGKKALSLTMSSRKPLLIDFLNPGGYYGCRLANYSTYSTDTELSLALDFAGVTASFTITPELPQKDGVSLVKEFVVKKGDTVITPASGVYKFEDVRLGTVCTITLTPFDTETYRPTTYTITAVLPQAQSLASVSFGTQDGDRGTVRVKLASPMRFGETLGVTVLLYKISGSSSTLIHTINAKPAFDPADPAKTVYEYDCRALLTSSGAGTYSVRAFVKGVPGTSSDGAYVNATLSLTSASFGPAAIVLSEPADRLHPAVGDVYAVTSVRDALGNILTSSALYQWYRVTASDPADPGAAPAPSPLYSGTAIYPGGSANSYTAAEADRGFRIEVEIAANGSVKRFTAYRKIEP